jgi:hypothetical protein
MYMISEKLKNQMHAKGVDSLDKVYMAISKFDKEGKNYVEKIYFENFLATIGIFLKTQELSELHKFVYTSENEDRVYFEAFINVLKVSPHITFSARFLVILRTLSVRFLTSYRLMGRYLLMWFRRLLRLRLVLRLMM